MYHLYHLYLSYHCYLNCDCKPLSLNQLDHIYIDLLLIFYLHLIKENLKGIEGDVVVQQIDYEIFLNSTNLKFDIVLLDPPYKTDYGIKSIELLIKNNLLNENAIVIFETSEENNFEIDFEGFDTKKKKYGKILVFKMEKI